VGEIKFADLFSLDYLVLAELSEVRAELRLLSKTLEMQTLRFDLMVSSWPGVRSPMA